MTEAELPATGKPPQDGSRWPVRVRLADLMLWVLGTGLAAAVCRESEPASWLSPVIDEGCLFALSAAILAVFLGIGLLRQSATYARRRGSPGGPWLATIAWRMVVLVLLGASVVATVRLLRSDVRRDAWLASETLRLSLLPLAITFAIAGVLAGLSPGRDRVRSPRMAWLSVVWAATAGMAIAANQVFVPYLILLAIHAVRNAMTGPAGLQPPRAGVDQRILSAGVEAVPALACCLLLALLLARELRRPAPRSGEADASERGLFALLATTAAAGAGAAWLLGVTIPRLDEWLAEGFQVAIDPLNAALIVFGFAGLAFGIAARAADRSRCSEPEPPVGRSRKSLLHTLRDLAIVLILLDVIIHSVVDFLMAQSPPVDESVPESPWTGWIGWTDSAVARLSTIFPRSRLILLDVPVWLILALGQAWVCWRVFALLIAPVGDKPTPVDMAVGDRRSFGRFAIRGLALTVLMVAALPTFFLVGLGLLSLFFRASG